MQVLCTIGLAQLKALHGTFRAAVKHLASYSDLPTMSERESSLVSLMSTLSSSSECSPSSEWASPERLSSLLAVRRDSSTSAHRLPWSPAAIGLELQHH